MTSTAATAAQAAAGPAPRAIPRPFGLWFGLLAPPVAWVAQGLGSVWVTSQACQHPGHAGVARWLLIGLALGGFVIAVAALTASSRALRRLGRSAGEPRRNMMAIGGIFLSITLGLGMLWGGLPALLLGGICEATR